MHTGALEQATQRGPAHDRCPERLPRHRADLMMNPAPGTPPLSISITRLSVRRVGDHGHRISWGINLSGALVEHADVAVRGGVCHALIGSPRSAASASSTAWRKHIEREDEHAISSSATKAPRLSISTPSTWPTGSSSRGLSGRAMRSALTRGRLASITQRAAFTGTLSPSMAFGPSLAVNCPSSPPRSASASREPSPSSPLRQTASESPTTSPGTGSTTPRITASGPVEPNLSTAHLVAVPDESDPNYPWHVVFRQQQAQAAAEAHYVRQREALDALAGEQRHRLDERLRARARAHRQRRFLARIQEQRRQASNSPPTDPTRP